MGISMMNTTINHERWAPAGSVLGGGGVPASLLDRAGLSASLLEKGGGIYNLVLRLTQQSTHTRGKCLERMGANDGDGRR